MLVIKILSSYRPCLKVLYFCFLFHLSVSDVLKTMRAFLAFMAKHEILILLEICLVSQKLIYFCKLVTFTLQYLVHFVFLSSMFHVAAFRGKHSRIIKFQSRIIHQFLKFWAQILKRMLQSLREARIYHSLPLILNSLPSVIECVLEKQ